MLLGNTTSFSATRPGSGIRILDLISSAPTAAYGLRRLRTAYTGPLIRIRRTSDNAELDINAATTIQTATNVLPLADVAAFSTVGTPGTFPANWLAINVAGVTTSIVGSGMEYGQSYIDVRWLGTATATQSYQFRIGRDPSNPNVFNPAFGAPWNEGETATVNFAFKGISGVLPANVTGRALPLTATGTIVSTSLQNTIGGITSQYRRVSVSYVAPATTARCDANFYFPFTTGVSYDFTIRIYSITIEINRNLGGPNTVSHQFAIPTAYPDELDVDAIRAFVPSNGAARVVTWYDQSGNGFNVTQATAAQQPHFVFVNSIYIGNARKMGVYFAHASDMFLSRSGAIAGIANAYKYCVATPYNVTLTGNATTTRQGAGFCVSATNAAENMPGTTPLSNEWREAFCSSALITMGSVAPSETTHVYGVRQNGSQLVASVDGVNSAAVAATLTAPDFIGLGASKNAAANNQYFEGLIHEAVYFSTLNTTDQATLQNAAMNFYGVT